MKFIGLVLVAVSIFSLADSVKAVASAIQQHTRALTQKGQP